MSRHIDAYLLLENLKKQYGEELGWQCTVNMSDVGMMIEDAPVADVQEIKHGHWIEENARPCSTKWICSECREISYATQHRGAEKQCTLNYCPHCGAKMDGKAE